MKTFNSLFVLLLVFSFATKAMADCRPAYQEFMEAEVNGKTFSLSAAMGAGAMTAVGTTSYEMGWLKFSKFLRNLFSSEVFPVLFVVSSLSTLYYSHPGSKAEAKDLIDQSYAGKGTELSRWARAFNVSDSKLAESVIMLNESDRFCKKQWANDSTIEATYLATGPEAIILLEKQILSPASP